VLAKETEALRAERARGKSTPAVRAVRQVLSKEEGRSARGISGGEGESKEKKEVGREGPAVPKTRGESVEEIDRVERGNRENRGVVRVGILREGPKGRAQTTEVEAREPLQVAQGARAKRQPSPKDLTDPRTQGSPPTREGGEADREVETRLPRRGSKGGELPKRGGECGEGEVTRDMEGNGAVEVPARIARRDMATEGEVIARIEEVGVKEGSGERRGRVGRKRTAIERAKGRKEALEVDSGCGAIASSSARKKLAERLGATTTGPSTQDANG
jgi:hypothetical protein